MSVIDAVTRIRNGSRRSKPTVVVKREKVTEAVLKVLESEGFIWGFEAAERTLVVQLKYGVLGNAVIRRLETVSTSSNRTYGQRRDLVPVLGGLGIAVVSTSEGMMSDRMARRRGLGGEILARVW